MTVPSLGSIHANKYDLSHIILVVRVDASKKAGIVYFINHDGMLRGCSLQRLHTYCFPIGEVEAHD